MHLLINTATTHKGGGVQVAKSFIEECKLHSRHRFTVILGLELSKLINISDYPGNFTFFNISYRPATLVFSFKDQAAFLKKIESHIQPDVVFTTSGPAYWKPQAPHIMGYNLPHYIYKDSPFFKMLSLKERMFWALKGRVIKYYTKRDADLYVVQTDDVNQRLKKWIGKTNIFTVSNTYGGQYSEPSATKERLPTPQANEFRLLLLSSFYRHKHFEIINEIVNHFEEGESIRFILTLPDETFHTIFSPKSQRFIHNVGPISPDECPGLYTECQGVFLPTLLECFSATYAEAMKMRVPIITTDMGFAHTVCGEAALYFEPMNSSDAYEKIKQLQYDKSIYDSLLQKASVEIKKFNSAEKRAQRFIQICEDIIR